MTSSLGSPNSFATPLGSPKAFFSKKNGLHSFVHTRSGSGNFSFINQSTQQAGPGYKIGLVSEALKRKTIAQLGAGVYESVSDTSFIGFVEWIRSERLTTLPHKGSRWDRVLIRALFFAEQLNNFNVAIQSFASDSSIGANLGYAHARLLLELGTENSEALDRAFAVFYKFSLSFSSLLHRSELLAATPGVREQLCLMYSDLLSLVIDVAITFYKAVKGMSTSSVTIDIFEAFGDTIEGFNARQKNITESIWQYQIDNEGVDTTEAIDVQTLKSWLAPQDNVLATLDHDHVIAVDNQAEHTCLWFQKSLTKFVNGKEHLMHITGKMGSGKTTLAGAIMDRLQRPINHKSFDCLFYSFDVTIPSQTTSLSLIRALLSQLLNLRVGNMAIYFALNWAHGKCHNAANPRQYEDYLWKSLADILKQPVEGGNDLVIIVDGIDELGDDHKRASTTLEKLSVTVRQSVGTRLIALSTPAVPSLKQGTHHEITHEDTHEDIHAVVLRGLMHNHHFHGKPGPEQETILDRIIHTSKGSFLWAILACEVLNLEKLSDGFKKTLEILGDPQNQTNDLVVKLFTALMPTNDAKTMLSWLLTTERPLNMDELQSLFSVDVQRATLSHTGVDIHSTVQSLHPFLTVRDGIVRFKHPLLQATLRALAIRNKIQIPIKDCHTALLLRMLTYVKATMHEKREPVLDGVDRTLAGRLFRQHNFLEYTVRYWITHFRHTSFFSPNDSEVKPTSEVQKVFPDITTMPILEQMCWDAQVPVSDVVDSHLLAANIRKRILTDHHPATLQSYLTCASIYYTLSKTPEAQRYYFISTKISRAIYSDIHPITLECAVRFLDITNNSTTNTRTEVVTHREEMLILLVAAYEKQFGGSSEKVMQIRETLATLYISIKEEKKAQEIYQIIQEATEHHGSQIPTTKYTNGHMDVVLGRGKGDREIKTYDKHLFTKHDDEEKIVDVFDTNQIDVWLQRAEDCHSQGDIVQAEKAYVELWQQVSSRCRTVQSIEWHEKHLDLTSLYSRFLQSQKRTSEAAAILISVSQQYQQHQLARSESIINRLTSIAKSMKSMGYHTMALSIFKFAESYYKSTRNDKESSQSSEVSREISDTSEYIFQQGLSSTTTITHRDNNTSDSSVQSIFQSIINSNHWDANTITMAKKLAAQYMEQHNWSAAEFVIKSSLDKTWSSFFSGSVNDVKLTSSYLQESISLIETLAECYRQQQRNDKVEDVYARFFRAVISSPNADKAVFEKAKMWLVNFYDKRGYPDYAISVFQDVLVVYRNHYGPAHEHTIGTLYTLGTRCRTHPRNHPYWIDYYQQIVTSLNKDSDHCHQNALNAHIIVANSYWEDRRFAEAVTVFAVLWNTFVRKAKEYKQFNDTAFVQNLYERYFQCLEETGASWNVLHKVTKEYRETAMTAYGAESTIVVKATLALARITQRSEEHSHDAIALYEQAAKSKSVSTSLTEIKHQLSTLYVRQLKSSLNVSSETMSRAINMHEEQFKEALQKHGASHETSLSHLHDLVVLYYRQQRTDAAVRQLTSAVSSIITHESSSQRLIDSASSIVASFQVIKQEQKCTELIQELHSQLCAKDSRHTSKWSFDLTKCSRSSLAFLASFEYSVRKDLAITFSEILADVNAEFFYFEQFRHVLSGKAHTKDLLLSAAPLRTFLLRKHLSHLAAFVEGEILNIFEKRDVADINVLSRESLHMFIVSLLEYLGSRKSTNFNNAVIFASNDHVASLIKQKKFTEAYDIANMAFLFASTHKGYDGLHSISHGFKLASLLVGRNGEKCPDATLRKKALELSNRVVKKILEISKDLKVNLAQVHLDELSRLAALLGEQQDYPTLEWLLKTLWNTRDAQRSWPQHALVNLGRRLVCARYLAGHPIKAIRLCEDIAYNMRRAHGSHSPITISTYSLLAQLYTSTGQSYLSKAATEKTGPLANEYFKKALNVHEDILHLLIQDHTGDDSDDDDTAAILLAEHSVSSNGSVDGRGSEALEQTIADKPALALQHLHLLKLAYQRAGGWAKPYAEYERLNAGLFSEFGKEQPWKGVQGVEMWSAKGFGGGKAEKNDGAFEMVGEWGIVDAGEDGADCGVNGHENREMRRAEKVTVTA